MDERPPSPRADDVNDGAVSDKWLTVPNVLCVSRLVGSLGLVGLALVDQPLAFVVLYLALTSTDWIDGRIARGLNQRSRIGPKLDTAADVTMYATMLFGTVWMFGSKLWDEWPWIAAVVVSYGVSCVASVIKFGRLPTYHTRAAKLSWFVVIPGVVAMFLDWSLWPLRFAAMMVAAANVEAVLITIVLPAKRDDVPSLRRALRISRRGDTSPDA